MLLPLGVAGGAKLLVGWQILRNGPPAGETAEPLGRHVCTFVRCPFCAAADAVVDLAEEVAAKR